MFSYIHPVFYSPHKVLIFHAHVPTYQDLIKVCTFCILYRQKSLSILPSCKNTEPNLTQCSQLQSVSSLLNYYSWSLDIPSYA